MRLPIKKCKNCNNPVLEGRSDKIYCSDNCRSNSYYQNKTLKEKVKKEKKVLDEVLAHINYLMLNINVVIHVNKTNNDSSKALELQMRLLKHYDCLSRLRKVEDYIKLKTKKYVN